MFLNALGIIALGLIFLILTIVSLVFTIISFANNKAQKFTWLIAFFIGMIGVIICVFMFVQKATSAINSISENTIGKFEYYGDSLNAYKDSVSNQLHQADSNSAQIKVLKNYLPTNVLNKCPEEFYTYIGFQDYYRYPLRYPYSIHCNYYNDGNGELYNEINVTRFDENDNGEIYSGISFISRITLDKNYLLIEQTVNSTRSDKPIKHYLLFVLDSEKFEEAKSEKELFILAKQKGYNGADTLMTLDQYYKLF